MKKVILITGASSGIGKAGALQLIREGHIVYTAARRISEMEDLRELGGRPLVMDVTRESDIRAGIEKILHDEGRIDVLWNNAGYGLYGSIEDVPLDQARRQMEVNLFGLAAVSQQVIPHMRKAGGGRIINTSSMGGKIYFPVGGWYHASKHAVEGMSDCMRLELKPFNIDVVVLEPGIIRTDFGNVLLDNFGHIPPGSAYTSIMQKMTEGVKKSYAKGGGSSPEVVARAVSRIVASTKPKTRYRVGKFAKPMVWMRLYLGDRLFDRVIMSQL